MWYSPRKVVEGFICSTGSTGSTGTFDRLYNNVFSPKGKATSAPVEPDSPAVEPCLGLRDRMKPLVSTILKNAQAGSQASISGWVQSVRKMKNVAFADVSDGSSSQPMNVVFNDPSEVDSLSTGACIQVDGLISESPGKQKFELQAGALRVMGTAGPDYPLQKKYHTREFLRTLPHLRWKTRQSMQVLRYRDWALRQLQQYFHSADTVQVNSPITTASDCEGAGEVFELKGSSEFFGKPAYLTVSSQLHLEVFAASLSRVWNFTPAFRAEASDTNRHLSEFWMVEVELAFLESLGDLTDYCEQMVRATIPGLLANDEMAEEILASKRNKEAVQKLENRWKLASKPWTTVSYTEALDLLNNSCRRTGGHTTETLKWGADLPSEHEKFLANEIVGGPVVVTEYPEQIKPFYMKQAGENTVACFDVLFPEIGEIVGGSLREDNYEVLKSRMTQKNMDLNNLEWYLDLRKYGSFPHGGYGLGFERLVTYLCGLDNIRDATGFIRSHGHLVC